MAVPLHLPLHLSDQFQVFPLQLKLTLGLPIVFQLQNENAIRLGSTSTANSFPFLVMVNEVRRLLTTELTIELSLSYDYMYPLLLLADNDRL